MPFEQKLEIEGAQVEHVANYLRMVPGPNTGKKHKCVEMVPLGVHDAEKVRQLLFVDRAYPDAWFNEDSLHSALYRGWVENNELLGVVGVHAASEEFGVAVTGNLAVRPDARCKGIARILKEALLNDLQERGWQSAFNVRSENASARAVHAKMGAQVVGTIREFRVTLR
jgi:ribosomal protein S18 acetylase RimI-like enzyme